LEEWKYRELNSYKEAYVHLCLPKICGVLIRPSLVLWNPFDENYEDIEKMEWFHLLAMYAKGKNETEEDLRNDPDLFLVPTIIEKLILPKLTSEFNS
jgi:GC-rich sequence DNA-binding factor